MGIAFRWMSLCLLAAISCIVANAQNASTNPKPSKPAATSSGQAAMPTLTAAPEMVKLIKAMAGNWTTTAVMEKGPMMPNGGTDHGTSKMWAGPAGMSLLQTYHSTGSMGNFSGVGTDWWDAQAQVYKGVWCDSMAPCNTTGTSKWDGDKLVGTMEGDMNGQKMITRITYSDFKPNSFVMTMDTGPDANSLQKMMTITYTRAAAKAAEGAGESKH
jgi:hypothetical protein